LLAYWSFWCRRSRLYYSFSSSPLALSRLVPKSNMAQLFGPNRRVINKFNCDTSPVSLIVCVMLKIAWTGVWFVTKQGRDVWWYIWVGRAVCWLPHQLQMLVYVLVSGLSRRAVLSLTWFVVLRRQVNDAKRISRLQAQVRCWITLG
jgi:hypothetical protein